MNPRNLTGHSHQAYNTRAKRSVYRKAEAKRLIAAGHTKKRAQQIAKSKGF